MFRVTVSFEVEPQDPETTEEDFAADLIENESLLIDAIFQGERFDIEVVEVEE